MRAAGRDHIEPGNIITSPVHQLAAFSAVQIAELFAEKAVEYWKIRVD
jgi:hypothetical protein